MTKPGSSASASMSSSGLNRRQNKEISDRTLLQNQKPMHRMPVPGESRPQTVSGGMRPQTVPGGMRPKVVPGGFRQRTIPGDVRQRSVPSDALKSRYGHETLSKKKSVFLENERPRYREDFRRKHAIESDEEEEVMDDFIDDVPVGDDDEDYSKHIREIFGYDKRKYAELDLDDDALMESSFARQMQEEAYSTRVGMLEDLEDIRKEQEELEKNINRKRNCKNKLAFYVLLFY